MAPDRRARTSALLGRLAAFTTAGVVGLGVCVATALAGPATYYVSASSADTTGSCTSSAPCRLDHAVALAAPGDDVIVLPGTYSITYPVSLSVAATLEGQPGQPRPSLVGAATLASDTVAVSGGAVVRHLDIATANNTGAQTAALTVDGGTAEDLSLFAGSSDSNGEALTVDDSAAGTVVRTILARSQAPDGEAVSFKDGSSPGTASVFNLTAIGEGNTTTAISGNVASGSVLVKDSIAAGRCGDVSTQPGTQNLVVAYSDFRPSSSSGYTDQGGNINAAPVFVNAGSEDYHETGSSPTVDAGAADASLSSADLDGNPRASGAAPDMGAYEYVGGVGSGSGGSGGSGTSGGSGGSASSGGSGGSGSSQGSGSSRRQDHELPPPSAPVAGVSVTLHPGSGAVRVELPGTHAFLPLQAASEVPVDSVIDATAGKVVLTSAVTSAGATKTGTFSGGRFVVRQSRSARPPTNLQLVGGSFAACRAVGSITHAPRLLMMAARRPSRHRVVRQLWGSDHGGSFVTIGRSASAAVRGTVWLTQDRCDGTLIRVIRGAVLVHDRGRRRDLLIRAGHAYLAHAKP